MTGVAVEQMLERWCVELRQDKAHLKSLFAHPSVAASAAAWAAWAGAAQDRLDAG